MTNAVTQRDFSRPMAISTFVKDVHAAFQVLNLKNDSLRRRGDGLKYHVSARTFKIKKHKRGERRKIMKGRGRGVKELTFNSAGRSRRSRTSPTTSLSGT